MKQWLDKMVLSSPPKSVFGKGVRYMLDRWDELNNFINDGRLEIDRVENWRVNQITRKPQMIPFPVPARQTGRALLTHPAFVQSHTFALGTSALT